MDYGLNSKSWEGMDDVRLEEQEEDDDASSYDDDDDEPHDTSQLPSVEQIRANAHLANAHLNLQDDDDKTENDSDNGATATKLPNRLSWCQVAVVGTCMVLAMALVGVGLGMVRQTQVRGPTAAARHYLELADISQAARFADAHSPQSKALKWMVQEDPRHLQLGQEDPNTDTNIDIDANTDANTDAADFVQRYVVAVFIEALVPVEARDSFYFFSGQHECDWNSEWYRSDASVVTMGIMCDDQQHVTDIVLQTVGLEGDIPLEIYFLPRLSTLALDVNHIGGAVPMIPTLTSLSLAYNELTGEIPTYVGLMTNLEDLTLSENLLQGTIPGDIEKLANLKILALDGNDLTSGLHSVYHLVHLEEIYLGFNTLEDGLDNASFQKLTNLNVLDLKNNKLHGPFPDALWTLTNLQVVDFHFNALDGHINDLARAHPIQFLDVSENFLGGGLPASMGNFMTDLTHLDLTSNRFEKELPTDLAALTKMESLLLSDNSEFGPQPIPEWLQGMTNLRNLSLKLTARTGTIPDWFYESLTNLETLDLDWNHISGTIATGMGNLSNLQHLLLNRNLLDGTIPTQLSQLPKLKMLMVDNNQFVGKLDACQVEMLVADCGDPDDGCPDCQSLTMEVNCPCCTTCCYDGDQHCNRENWLTEIEVAWRDDYDEGAYTFAAGEKLEPAH
jgi:Leucine-rich repeat (LRR) protein